MRRRLSFLSLACLLSLMVAAPWLARTRKPTMSQGPGHAAGLGAPAGDRPVKIDPAGSTVLPNGRLITPLGKQVTVAPHPYGLALSPDGKTLVTANSGTHPFSVSIISGLGSGEPAVTQIPPGYRSSDADPDSVFMGVAIAPNNRALYLSEGNNGHVGTFDLLTHKRVASMSLDGDFHGKKYAYSLTGELKLSPDGRRLYVLDLAHFCLVTIDTESQQMLSSVAVGRLPFGLALSPDGRRAYVSNVGMFRYSPVPGYDEKNPRTGLDFPAFGFRSKEAEEGLTVHGVKVPGLGDPNSPESNSLWVVDIVNPVEPRVVAKIPTGQPVGEKSVGGSSPGAVVAGRKKIYVSNSAQDSISIIDAGSMLVEKTVVLEPADSVRGLRGVLPFGMALSPDEKRLYVACAGINAVAVLDTRKGEILGYFPTAWFPARLAVSLDGNTLYVSNAKGFGAGPNGGTNFKEGPEGTYIGDITKGTVSFIPLPAATALDGEGEAPAAKHRVSGDDLELLTQRVLVNNGFLPSGGKERSRDFPVPPPDQASVLIHHVVFIVKENRTFDQVFGDLGMPGVDGERDLAEYGEDVTVKDKDTRQSVEQARVTPNHHALARRFAFSDNFYVDSDVSADGHHWLVGTYPNELLEAAWPASYGERFEFRLDDETPGRMEVSAGLFPETYLEAGSLWEHLARHHVTFRNYGEDLEGLPGANDGPPPSGVRESVNVPIPEVLFENTSHDYATFDTSIPDQYRFAQFRREFDVRYASGKEPLPQFLYIWLPNDHTAKPRPSEGYPLTASYVADNDLALGKLVELFSHSSFWKDTAIFVTEDDAQDGRDHIDAHRSLLLVISPYARRGVSHVHTSMASILKTFNLLLGLPPLNQYDAAATDLSDCFTGEPDLTPYDALPSDPRVFDPAKAVVPGTEMQARPSEPFDDPATIRRELRRRVHAKDDN